jgi:hypothetical protein
MATIIVTSLVFTLDVAAQRRGEVQRRGAVNRGALPRHSDLRCVIDGEGFHDGEVREVTPPGGTIGSEDYTAYVKLVVVNEGSYGATQFPLSLGIRHNGGGARRDSRVY